MKIKKILFGNISNFTLLALFLGITDFNFASETKDRNKSEEILIEDIVILANSKDDRLTSPFINTRISKEKIEEENLDQFVDLLKHHPSLSAAGNGYHRAPSIRGLSRRRALILVNGERIDTLRNTGPSASYVSPFGIEEISILRGPFSSIYGSDAIGGIVNIITKAPDLHADKNYHLGLHSSYISNRNGTNNGLNLALGDQDLYYSLVGSYRNIGDVEYKDGKVENSSYSDFNLINSVFWKFTEKQSLKIEGRYAKGIDIGKPTGDPNRNGYHPEELNQSISIKYLNQFNGNLFKDMRAIISFKKINLSVDMESKNIEKSVRAENKKYTDIDSMYSYQIYQTLTPTSFATVLVGSSGYIQDGVNVHGSKKVYELDTGFFKMDTGDIDFIKNGEMLNSGIFAELSLSFFDNLNIETGLRYDYFRYGADWITEESGSLGISSESGSRRNETKDSYSYHFGASYSFTHFFSLFANAGSAFRLPSIKELYYSGNTPNGYNISDPDLKPEKSYNHEAGLKWVSPRIDFSLVFFYNTIYDYISINWNEDHSIGQFGNIGEAVIKGVELDFEISLGGGFRYYIGGSYLQGRDKNLEEPLSDTPPPRIITSLSHESYFSKNLFTKNGLRFVYSFREEEAVVGDEPAASYYVIDYLLSISWTRKYKFNFSITNLLNEKYRPFNQLINIYDPGRGFNLALHINI